MFEVPRYFGAMDGQSESGNWVHIQDYLQLLKRLSDATEALAEAQAKLRWIPVSERLPDPGAYYHVWDDDEFIPYAYLETTGKWSDGEWLEYKNVTHWMPLIPTPPEGE